MSLTLDFDVKERVRAAIDIVDLVSGTLELRPQGRAFVARCPWHNDKRPSLQVNPQRQIWKCWVCNLGGDIFSFVMQRDGVDFNEALKTLADRAGIEIRRGGGPKPAAGSTGDKATLHAVLKFAVDAYFDCLQDDALPASTAARDYLATRGIDEASRLRFRIGYSPDDWSWLLGRARKAGFSNEVVQAAGLAIARDDAAGHYDRFRGRLMFPIYDLQDRPISMGGRVIPSHDHTNVGAKYINGPETLLFSKSRQLYGLNLARTAIQKAGQVLVMEGYTDVIAARQAGIETAVAVLGTALGEQHIEILRRFVDRVVLVLDGDDAGRSRADQVLELFVKANVDLRIVTLPGNADPAEFVASQGRDAFEHLIEEAPDAFDYKLANLTAGIDVTTDTHRATTAMQKMLAVIAMDRSNPLRTSQMLLRLSRTFGLAPDDLRKQLETLGPARSTRIDSATAMMVHEAIDRPSPKSRPLAMLTGMERELFEIMIEQPLLSALALEQVDAEWLPTETARRLFSLYRDLELDGRELDFDTVLMAIDSEPLKNVWVTLSESIQKRGEVVSTALETRFENLLKRFQNAQAKVDAQRNLARLEHTQVGEDEAANLLQTIIEAQRMRQGIRSASGS